MHARHAQCLSFKSCLVKRLGARQAVELGLAKDVRYGVRRQHGQVCKARLYLLGEAVINPVCCLCLPPLPKELALCCALQFSTRFTGFRFLSLKVKNSGALKLGCLWTDSLPLVDCNTVQCNGDTLKGVPESSKQPCWKANISSGTAGRQYILTENLMNALAYTITKDTWGRGEIIDTFSSEENGAQPK